MRKSEITKPILFMVFNRPEITKKSFNAIRKVEPEKLYIAADAPRKHIESDEDQCNKVRDIVQNIDWKCNVKYLFHEHNHGGGLAGKKAWDWIFSYEDEMIMIEDDGVVSESFFGFCQELLDKYRNNAQIALIGGVNYGPVFGESTYFFSRICAATYCMATWKRTYDLYEFEMDSYLSVVKTKKFKEKFSIPGSYYLIKKKFDNYIKGKSSAYDIQLTYLSYLYDMYSIAPNVNMGSNIGLESGAHNNLDPNSHRYKMLANRPRFDIDIKKIAHPTKISVDDKFEKKYFKIRVLYGSSLLNVMIKLYIYPLLSPIKRKIQSFIKK